MTPQDYMSGLRALLDGLDLASIETFISLLLSARKQNRTVFIIGNGGSAATASHFANDLSKAAGVRAISLADNMALLTAYANDCGYSSVYTEQLKRLASYGDMLVAISVSGNSPNVVNAAKLVGERGVLRVGLTGNEGGALSDWVDIEIRIPTPSYGLAEDIHLMICHMVTEALKDA